MCIRDSHNAGIWRFAGGGSGYSGSFENEGCGVMTELQMGLIGLGATAVVGVLGYNKWQEYRHRKLAEACLLYTSRCV